MEDVLALMIPIVAIVGGISAGMFKQWLRFKERQTAALSNQTAEKAAQYAAKTERLEQRVAVLERILTDRSSNLADEIDRLRDSPLN
jgi:phage shock protein B